MDKRTANALEASIAHWERNVAIETPKGISLGSAACALCTEFRPSCDGCPVKDETGEKDCIGSPYEAAADLFCSWKEYPGGAGRFAAWRAAAQRELDFLKSLRNETQE
jgi:hypothetical protein